MRYRQLTAFYGTVERALALTEKDSPRYYDSVHDAVQEAIRLGETGPFNVITRIELVPDEPNRGDKSNPVYWTPPPPKAPPDPVEEAKTEARKQLQEDIYSALINFGARKSVAIATAKALPIEITELSPALSWAMRGK